MMYRMSLISALVVALLLIGCASQQVRSREPKEPLHGTWENKDYSKTNPRSSDPKEIEEVTFNIMYPAKIVFTPDGKFPQWRGGAIYTGVRAYTITSKWTDSEGNLWYKVVTNPGNYLLIKVDSSYKTLKLAIGKDDYPTEIDLKRYPTDRIYYRK